MVHVLSDSLLAASHQAAAVASEQQPHPVTDGSAASAAVVALTRAYCSVDGEFLALARSKRPPMNDGTTALTALICDDMVHVANVGDSRAVLVRVGGGVMPLSSDHKPNRRDEVARIVAAGGRVLFNGIWRVCGVLAVSRAIGDRVFKPAIVTCQPEVVTYGPIRRAGRGGGGGGDDDADAATAAGAPAPAAAAAAEAAPSSGRPPASVLQLRPPRDLALVLASDGLFDTLSNEHVGAIVAAALHGDEGARAQHPPQQEKEAAPPPPGAAAAAAAATSSPVVLRDSGAAAAAAAGEPGVAAPLTPDVDPLDACTCDGRSPQAEAAALRLVSAALDRGSFDNVTALVIDLRALAPPCATCAASELGPRPSGTSSVR